MVVILQVIYVGIALVSCGALAYGVQRLRHPAASLYWADLILTALCVVCVTSLFLIVSVVWTADLGRLGVGGLSLSVISYRLRHMDQRLWRDGENWYHHMRADVPLIHRLHHFAALVHWHA